MMLRLAVDLAPISLAPIGHRCSCSRSPATRFYLWHQLIQSHPSLDSLAKPPSCFSPSLPSTTAQNCSFPTLGITMADTTPADDREVRSKESIAASLAWMNRAKLTAKNTPAPQIRPLVRHRPNRRRRISKTQPQCDTPVHWCFDRNGLGTNWYAKTFHRASSYSIYIYLYMYIYMCIHV